MDPIIKKLFCGLFVVAAVAGMHSCQKMERPELGELILDPPPPPYSILKSFWAFEGNPGDSGQFRSLATATNITYVEGVNGQAARINPDGYVLISNVPDSLKTPGSFTITFWMNGVGPVVDGAQGLFSISNSAEFWGNFDMFLENNDNGDEAFLKVHMFTYNRADGKAEEWSETKIAGALNKWTHIAVTYNSADSKLSIYADGQPTSIHEKIAGGGNFGNLVFNNVNGMVIGTYQFQTTPPLSGDKQDWARSFNGALDQFRIYNVPLTASEVNDLFTSKE